MPALADRPPMHVIDSGRIGRTLLHIGLVVWLLISIGSCVDAHAAPDGPGPWMQSKVGGIADVRCGRPSSGTGEFPVAVRIVSRHIGTIVAVHLWVNGRLSPGELMQYVSKHEPAMLKDVGNLVQSCLEAGAGSQV